MTPHILQIDTSARVENSHSRQLTHCFVTALRQAHLSLQVTYRDIGTHPIPHVDERWVAAYEAQPPRSPDLQASLTLSEALIDELLAADGYVFGIPMYNLTVPSTVKAYLDQVVRRDRIFTFQNGQPQGHLQGKKLLIITTRKFNYRPGSGRETRDFLEPYLRRIWSIIGVDDITFVHADDLANDATRHHSLTTATETLERLASRWLTPVKGSGSVIGNR